MDPPHFDADRDADPDPTYHFDADPDPDSYLMRIRIQLFSLMRILLFCADPAFLCGSGSGPSGTGNLIDFL